jgi:RNA polymerase sigma-70 factor (ECF subfamily)
MASIAACTSSDEELGPLMQAAQTGDAEAYAALLEAVAPRVRQVVQRRRGFAGPEDVEDLVQDVLLSLHIARATYDPERPFMPWLMAIVRHRLADGARRYVRRASHEVAVDNLAVTFEDVATNTIGELAGETHALNHAIRALPAGQREAIELLKLRELSLKEAATATGVSVGALKVATHRAVAMLRRMLATRETHGH